MHWLSKTEQGAKVCPIQTNGCEDDKIAELFRPLYWVMTIKGANMNIIFTIPIEGRDACGAPPHIMEAIRDVLGGAIQLDPCSNVEG